MYAGKECARALAKDSLDVADCREDVADCSAKELQRLQQQLEHIKATYDEVGKVCLTAVSDSSRSHQMVHHTASQRCSKQAAGQCSSSCLWPS